MSIEVEHTGAAKEMPKYQCHKQVWALKIAAIEFADSVSGKAKIAPADAGYAPFETGNGYRRKVVDAVVMRDESEADDLGYYVRYEDGYESWSPSKAFEEGYTPQDRGRRMSSLAADIDRVMAALGVKSSSDLADSTFPRLVGENGDTYDLFDVLQAISWKLDSLEAEIEDLRNGR